MKTFQCLLAVSLLLLAVPAVADDAVLAGADLWRTPADGSTYYDFGADPIPAGFFCRGSAAFDGKVTFHGVPLATSPEGALGRTDTIVERLDDAPFGAHGRALTRIRPLALSLASDQLIETRCGDFQVRVELADVEQPVADMVIVKQSDRGGYFNSSLSLETRMTFVGDQGQRRALDRRVDFPYSTRIAWSHQPPAGQRLTDPGLVSLDLDRDGVAEALVPGVGNFYAGVPSPDAGRLTQTPILQEPDWGDCHSSLAYQHQHCTNCNHCP